MLTPTHGAINQEGCRYVRHGADDARYSEKDALARGA